MRIPLNHTSLLSIHIFILYFCKVMLKYNYFDKFSTYLVKKFILKKNKNQKKLFVLKFHSGYCFKRSKITNFFIYISTKFIKNVSIIALFFLKIKNKKLKICLKIHLLIKCFTSILKAILKIVIPQHIVQ